MNRLEPILASTRLAVEGRRRQVPVAELERSGGQRAQAGEHRSFHDALRAPGLALVAEHKRRSPSAGRIREDLELSDVVGCYERAGAAALSILTEEENFGGSLDDLRVARAASRLPLLRKDFVVDPYQVLESFAAGADAILLIVAALPAAELVRLRGQALDLGLSALVEVHDRAELDTAMEAGADIIGINNRDLTTLEVDPRRTYELLEAIPSGTTVVSESGLHSPEQLGALSEAGVNAVLIGEALMRAPDIEAACRRLSTAGRSEHAAS